MSPLFHRIEQALFIEPWSPWVFCGLAALLIASIVMVGFKLAPSFNRNLVLPWAYHRPRLLRISQSPAWFGVCVFFCGLVLFYAAALKVDPRLKTWTSDTERRACPLNQQAELQDVQAKWEAIFKGKQWFHLWGEPWPIPENPTVEILRAEAIKQEEQARAMEATGLGLLPLGLILFLCFAIRESAGDEHAQHSNAAWASRGEVRFRSNAYIRWPMRVAQRGNRAYKKAFRAPFTVLAPSQKSAASHGLIIGATGAGKGAYTQGHFFMTSRVPIIYQDSKGECPAWPIRPHMLRWGLPAEKPKGLPSMRWNPIADVLAIPDESRRADVARTLANLLLPPPPDNNVNKWITETAQPILRDGILSGRWKHMGELADEVEGRKLPGLLKELGVPEGRIFSLEGKNVMQYAANEISNNTQPYLRGWARHATSESDFTLADVMERGLYVMSASSDPFHKRPITLFWNVLWGYLKGYPGSIPCLVLIDEAIAVGRIPGIVEAAVELRDRGVSVWMAFQTFSGIDLVYPMHEAETIRRILVNRVVLTNGLSIEDSRKVSEDLGCYTKTKTVNKEEKHDSYRLLPFEALKNLAAREEVFAAILRGRGFSDSGREIFASLIPIKEGLWNCLPPLEKHEAEEQRYGHGQPIESRFLYLRNKPQDSSDNTPSPEDPEIIDLRNSALDL